MVSHLPAVFGGHWSNTSEDIAYLIYHVTPQDHMIEGSRNFMSGTALLHVTTLPSLVVIGILVVEYNVFNLSFDLARPSE